MCLPTAPRSLLARDSTFTITSGVRCTVRRMCSTSAEDNLILPRGPPRPWLRMFNNGSSAGSLNVFAIATLPAGEIRLEQRLSVVAQRLADFEHRAKLLLCEAREAGAYVRCPGNLIEVSTDGGQLAYAAL